MVVIVSTVVIPVNQQWYSSDTCQLTTAQWWYLSINNGTLVIPVNQQRHTGDTCQSTRAQWWYLPINNKLQYDVTCCNKELLYMRPIRVHYSPARHQRRLGCLTGLSGKTSHWDKNLQNLVTSFFFTVEHESTPRHCHAPLRVYPRLGLLDVTLWFKCVCRRGMGGGKGSRKVSRERYRKAVSISIDICVMSLRLGREREREQ